MDAIKNGFTVQVNISFIFLPGTAAEVQPVIKVEHTAAKAEQTAVEMQQDPEPESAGSVPPPEPTESTQPSDPIEEKREIIRRLKEYRKTQGLGSLEKLSAKTAHQKTRRISAETLRNICSDGVPKMPIENWRKIGRALDLMEKEAQKESG